VATTTSITYLVAAHRDPEHCRRLLRALQGDGVSIYVHVDAREPIESFFVDAAGVTFLQRRLAVNRGGWSLARVLMHLLAAGHAGSPSEWFAYLAGTDYPLRGASDILRHLAEGGPGNYLNHYPLVAGASARANLTRYHFVDTAVRAEAWLAGHRSRPVDRTEPLSELVGWLNHVLPRRRFPAGFVPFRGSSRWVLDRETVAFAIAQWVSPTTRRLRRYLRHTWGADEMFLQTVIFNSPLARRCRLYDASAVCDIVAGRQPPWEDEVRPYLHYIDWDPGREDPAILDTRDFARLRDSGKLFACKFASDRSRALLDRIDAELLA